MQFSKVYQDSEFSSSNIKQGTMLVFIGYDNGTSSGKIVHRYKDSNGNFGNLGGTWQSILNKPTTISGYSITDLNLSGNTLNVGASTISIPQNASQITVNTAGYFVGNNVQSVIQEIGQTLNGLQSTLESI